MQILIACFIGLMLSLAAEAEPVVEGQVRLAAGESVAGAQVLLFDLGNLRRGAVAQATTDAAGGFVLWLGMRPTGFGLGQNYPNPFNPSTIIPYELAAAAQVRLEVFNSVGQRVATLVDGEQPAGAYRVQWNGTDAAGRAVAAGVYLYRLTADGTSQTGRMVLVDGQAGFDKTSTSSVEPLSPQKTPTASWAEPVEVHPTDAAYGLVVSGVGLETYVDADFRIEAEMGPVVVEAHQAGRGKATQTRNWILGDVDNNQRVTLADALLVTAYSLDSSIEMPDGGAIWLGDVNGDSRIDGADAQLIEQYSRNPASHPSIGKRLMLRPVPARIVGRLGDVDNNQRVTLADALLVTAYSLDPSIEVPDGGAIWLGDVNGDSRIDGADAQLIEQYSRNANAAELPAGMGELVTIGPIIGPIQPPVEPVEPPPAGLLTIPPVTLTVGSSYGYSITKTKEFPPGQYARYGATSNNSTIVTVKSGADDPSAGRPTAQVRIEGKALGTAEVTLSGNYGDAQTIPVEVVERPPSIDSVWPGEPKTEDITMVFYIVEGVLDPIEEKIPWFFLHWRLGLGAADLLLEYLGFGSTEIETRDTQITWVEYEHSQTTAYAVSKQPVSVYHSTSGLLTEAFVTLQEAKENVLQDMVLELAPGWLSWPATAWSVVGDIQMYASILDVVLAVERDESTKVELIGLLAKDGSIIPGNSYLPLLMMKNDAENETADFDLRLRVTKDIDIASAEVAIRSHETIDFGPFDVPPKTGYQILSNHTLTFTEQAGRDLKRVELELHTDGYDQNKAYRVRARGPSLAVEEVRASASMFDSARPEGEFEVSPNDQFTLWAKVLNRSETYASSASALHYYCSSDPVIDPSAVFNDDLLLEGLEVAVEPLAGLGETEKTVWLPAPRLSTDRTGTEVPGTCWASDLSKPVYYGACVWDEVEREYNACSWGVPVEVSSF